MEVPNPKFLPKNKDILGIFHFFSDWTKPLRGSLALSVFVTREL
jgi:hypothetical protein